MKYRLILKNEYGASYTTLHKTKKSILEHLEKANVWKDLNFLQAVLEDTATNIKFFEGNAAKVKDHLYGNNFKVRF